jgi:O-antigen/teichoic acid export membrane protein
MLKLIKLLITYFKSFFSNGHARTITAKKNVAISFLIKGGSIIISIIVVPLTINFVNPIQYGIWLTISSLISWFGFFDIGLGNGLKNKLSEAIANNDSDTAKTYVSTTYVLMMIISACLLMIFFIINYFVSWTKILNAPPQLAGQLKIVLLLVILIFAFQFVLQLLNVVLAAKQKVMLASMSGFLGNLLGLIVIFVLTKTTKGSLISLCLSIGVTPLIVLAIFSIVLYNTSYKSFSPSFKYVKFKHAKGVLNLGLKFFFVQLGSLFFFNSDNIIITQIIGPQAVTSYNIAFKYFSIVTMISGIIMSPFWPAFTEAHVKNDYDWIKKIVNRLKKIGFILTGLSLLMLIASPFIYHVWIGNKVSIPFGLSIVLALYTCITTFRTVFYTYSYATGKINVQLIMVLVAGIINIPLGIFLAKLMGVTGVILSTTILIFLCCIVEIIQYSKLINNKAVGVWNR